VKACLALFILRLSLLAAEKPNLIVIMTDDMGYADVGFNGCKDIPTPHIDSIAANGVKFTSGYVAYPVCGPSRAAFMTGRYGQRFGFERNPQYRTQDENMGLPFSEETIAERPRQSRVTTPASSANGTSARPKSTTLSIRGFQEFYGHLGGGHQYFPKELTIKDSDTAENESQSYRTWILRNHEPVAPRKYLTTEFSDEAVSFIERNSAKPFFLFLSYNAPHAPLQAPGEYLKRFPHIEKKQRKIYAAMVSAVDDGVGRVLKTLREKEIEKDTLVVFLSDNGGPTTKNGSNNAPLRGGKGDAWEGGWRVPFAMQWPGGLPKGKTYSHPVISLDIMATIVALTKAPVAKERPLDGVNLSSLR
jgi:arylsulfatase A-like enzyme